MNGAKLPVILLQEVPKSQPSVRPGETLDFRAEVYAAFRDAARARKDFPVRRRVSVLCQQTYLFSVKNNHVSMNMTTIYLYLHLQDDVDDPDDNAYSDKEFFEKFYHIFDDIDKPKSLFSLLPRRFLEARQVVKQPLTSEGIQTFEVVDHGEYGLYGKHPWDPDYTAQTLGIVNVHLSKKSSWVEEKKDMIHQRTREGIEEFNKKLSGSKWDVDGLVVAGDFNFQFIEKTQRFKTEVSRGQESLQFDAEGQRIGIPSIGGKWRLRRNDDLQRVSRATLLYVGRYIFYAELVTYS